MCCRSACPWTSEMESWWQQGLSSCWPAAAATTRRTLTVPYWLSVSFLATTRLASVPTLANCEAGNNRTVTLDQVMNAAILLQCSEEWRVWDWELWRDKAYKLSLTGSKLLKFAVFLERFTLWDILSALTVYSSNNAEKLVQPPRQLTNSEANGRLSRTYYCTYNLVNGFV